MAQAQGADLSPTMAAAAANKNIGSRQFWFCICWCCCSAGIHPLSAPSSHIPKGHCSSSGATMNVPAFPAARWDDRARDRTRVYFAMAAR
eukprot:4000367-Amphidinium_carterae.1